MFENVFVTVGTTSFQPLIKLVVSDKAAQQFRKWGVKKVLIQGGKHSVEKESNTWTQNNVEFEMYDYKESLKEDMSGADLIICHAGAGTTVEALEMEKVVLVVPNETLLDNHQIQLAKKFEEESYAFVATIDTFFEKLADVDPSKVKPFPPSQEDQLFELLIKKEGERKKAKEEKKAKEKKKKYLLF